MAASVVVCWLCVCVFACVCICVCARISVRERVCAYACVCPGMCAFVCARVHLFLQFCILARVCVCAARGGVGPPMGTGGIYSSACDARTARACVLRWRWPSVGSLVRTQARRGRAVRPARRGLREMGTRPWSTPPAPSTSSAAAAPPTTGTCGRAPTEVRDRTRAGDGRGVLGGYDRVLEGT